MKQSNKVFILSILLMGCETIIDLDYKGNRSLMVIEGNITNEPGPYFVRITQSVPLDDSRGNPSVDNAVVTISDDAGNSEMLAAQGNGIYRTSATVGEEGRTYTLNVRIGEQTYTAASTMPKQVPFDDILVNKVSIGGDIERDLVPKYLDPVENGNFYRFVLMVNNKLINQHLIQNDEIRNGLVNTIKLEVNDNELKFEPGDRVRLTMQCIDRSVASYYMTLVLIADSGPGGGTTPNNPKSNISNGALGVFSAHTVETRSVAID